MAEAQVTGPVVSARKGFPSPKPLARLLPLLAPYRTRLAVAFVCLLVAAAAGLVFPLVLRFLLDAAFEQKDRVALDRVAELAGAPAARAEVGEAQRRRVHGNFGAERCAPLVIAELDAAGTRRPGAESSCA